MGKFGYIMKLTITKFCDDHISSHNISLQYFEPKINIYFRFQFNH